MIKRFIVFSILSWTCQGKVFRFDYEFNEPADGWFKLHVIPSTWREARLRCLAEGTLIASPVTIQLKKAITAFVLRKKGSIPTTIFTGVHATFSKGDYITLDGVPISRLPIVWAPGEPDNYNNEESCLAMVTDSNGSMSDVRCDDVLPYVCCKKFAHLTMNRCGTTDRAYNLEPRTGSCYKFHQRGMVWQQAFMTCTAEGGYLAIINSEVEMDAIKEIFDKNAKNIRSTDPWVLAVGFHDWGEHMSYLTIHSETLDQAGYQSWAEGQPDNATHARTGDTGEFCGTVFRDGRMNDHSCNIPIAFICEKNRDSLL